MPVMSEQRTCQTAQQPIRPACDEPAQQHGDVHGAVDCAGFGDGVEHLRQHNAQCDAHGGYDGFFDGGHFFHFCLSPLSFSARFIWADSITPRLAAEAPLGDEM